LAIFAGNFNALRILDPASVYYTLDDIKAILSEDERLALGDASQEAIVSNVSFLKHTLQNSDSAVYGINTGFGALCQVRISDSQLENLQKNLVMSHACGAGDKVDVAIVRIMLLLKIMSLSKGYSGVRLEVVQRLLDFYNEGVYPVVYEQGSLGASGDLAPLAHLSLPLLGMGEVMYKGELKTADEVLAALDWPAMRLEAKEGLALLNGTQFSTALALHSYIQAQAIASAAEDCAALSCDAFLCNESPFLSHSHRVRPHAGQQQVAKAILDRLQGSDIFTKPKEHVQDPYSFRCIPQVHGATRDVMTFVAATLETEMNSVTDNPNIFEEEGLILSAGNFHAQPIAYASDFLAIALAELANISERRIFQLISGLRGLPPFLVSEPGINSGLMIAQYTAASVVSQNKQWCTPASVDSIVSSAGQEDHVSMAANAGTKLMKVVSNVWTVLGIEWLCAAQALEFRRPARTSPYLETLVGRYREMVPFIGEDRVLYPEMQKSRAFIQSAQAMK
jgi:histidine ammonia-lyase